MSIEYDLFTNPLREGEEKPTLHARAINIQTVNTDKLAETIEGMSTFTVADIKGAIKAIGAILLGFGIVQIGLALKGHDASQRAQGFMTFFGGVIIYFAKDILDMIL